MNTYHQLLRAEFESRSAVHPRYSLRAFARDLGISASRLSQIFQKKQGLSESRARVIARKLWMSEEDVEYFCDLVTLSDSRSKAKRRAAEIKVLSRPQVASTGQVVREDVFRVISDWYHYAILELTALTDFKSSPIWIAKTLGISRIETEEAIARLKRVGLLGERRGKLFSVKSHLTTTNGVSSEAIQKFNRQLLEKATRAIVLQPIEERDISTLTVAISSGDFKEFQRKIREFRKALNSWAMERASQNPRSLDSVYALAIQFFRLNEKTAESAQKKYAAKK